MRLPLAAAFLAVVTAAHGQNAVQGRDIPILDVDGLCAKQTHCPTGDANCKTLGLAIKACVYRQQQAYDLAKRLWPRLPEGGKTECVERLRREYPDYRILSACASLQLRIARRNSAIAEQGKFRP